jgi:hypothetical protein
MRHAIDLGDETDVEESPIRGVDGTSYKKKQARELGIAALVCRR